MDASDLKPQEGHYYYSSKLNIQDRGSHLLFICAPCMTSAMLPIHIESSVWPSIFKTLGIVCDTTKSRHTAKTVVWHSLAPKSSDLR